MKKYFGYSIAGVMAASLLSACSGAANAESAEIVEAKFTSSGAVEIPENWREWIFIGTPLTPNALNGGEAPFPEFHNVYIEPSAYKHFVKTGEWAEGTQIAKELVSVRPNNNAPDGSSQEVSGRGYFQGEFNGLELTVKDNKRFSGEPGGWAYFTFGHQPEPYNQTAEASPTEACNVCHEVGAETDFVFTQFYPVVRAVQE